MKKMDDQIILEMISGAGPGGNGGGYGACGASSACGSGSSGGGYGGGGVCTSATAGSDMSGIGAPGFASFVSDPAGVLGRQLGGWLANQAGYGNGSGGGRGSNH
jgi:hypothetical protein